MAEFLTLSGRLASAVKTRLGEPVVLTPLNRGSLSLRAIVRRNVELVGDTGRVSDARDTVRFAAADVPAELTGATLIIGGSEQRVLEALVMRDSSMVEWALR